MEAMAAGVPPLAPDVGGMADLVSDDFGVLMGDNPSVEDIADGIEELMKKARSPEIRRKARERVENRFNAAKNYPEFIERLHALAAGKR
jgi:colanic acid/amylovoran biosynthesis glycosyltransferase